jgi:hypothetical protein
MIEASTEIKPPGWAFGQRVHAPAFESGRRDGENWEPIVGTTSGSEPLLGCPTRSRHCKRHAPIASDPSRTVPFSGRPRSAYDVRGRVLDQFWIGSRPPSHAIDRPVSRAEPAGDLSETQAFALESFDFDWVQRSPWAASAVHRRRQWTPPPARPGLVTKVCPRVCPKVCPSRGDSGGHGVSVSTEK